MASRQIPRLIPAVRILGAALRDRRPDVHAEAYGHGLSPSQFHSLICERLSLENDPAETPAQFMARVCEAIGCDWRDYVEKAV